MSGSRHFSSSNSPAWAALRGEVAALRRHMHKNHTHLVQGGATGLLEKEHIWEAELLMAETQVGG
jgi:hypothetical protein